MSSPFTSAQQFKVIKTKSQTNAPVPPQGCCVKLTNKTKNIFCIYIFFS